MAEQTITYEIGETMKRIIQYFKSKRLTNLYIKRILLEKKLRQLTKIIETLEKE